MGGAPFTPALQKKTAGSKWRFELVGSQGQILIDKDDAELLRDGQREKVEPPEAPLSGIPAGVRELVEILDRGGATSSPIAAAIDVVEVIFGFI